MPALAGGQLDRLDDLGISGTAAEIAGKVVPDVVVGGIRLSVQQLPGHEDEPRRTIAALEGTALDERLLFR